MNLVTGYGSDHWASIHGRVMILVVTIMSSPALVPTHLHIQKEAKAVLTG
jgi:hypothetical protein